MMSRETIGRRRVILVEPSCARQQKKEPDMINSDLNKVTQFSVSLITKPGTLSQVVEALYKGKCDIAAMTLVDVSEHGTLRLVFNGPDEQARKILGELNAGPVYETKVLALTMSNRPGAIADAARKLAEGKVNVQYAYVTSGAPGGKTIGIFKVSDPDKAVKLLAGMSQSGSKWKDTRGRVVRSSFARR